MSKYAGFNTVQLTRPQRSTFDLSHQKRLTTRMGRLTPVFFSEAIPGDTFRGNSEILLRVAPLLAPIFDMMTLYVHYFFVPNRLLWDDWEPFITGGRLGDEASPEDAPLPPYYSFFNVLEASPQSFAKSSLLDYLGMPIIADIPGYTVGGFEESGATFDILPCLAYQKAWYDYYRDRNFVPDTIIDFPVSSGEQGDLTIGQYLAIRGRAFEHDYFTSALPFTQRGAEVLMPLAGTGSVTYLDQSLVRNSAGALLGSGTLSVGGAGPIPPGGLSVATAAARVENIDDVLLDASNVSINDFRTAYALQVWLERNAIAGSRYNESTLAHFGVRPQDERLQRAEYLGGGRIPVKISEIVSTAYSTDGEFTFPLANLAGHGITYGDTNRFNYFCPEHGMIIGIASIMSPASYHQGMPRHFRRRTFLDYPWPTFAKLGEQQVDRSELYASAFNLTEDEAGQLPMFGYQSRYADWKHLHNSNHGDFHDDLLFWTLTRQFAVPPTLSEAFVLYDQTLQDRIFAVNGSADNFWLYVHNNVSVKRALPYFGTPNTLGFQ